MTVSRLLRILLALGIGLALLLFLVLFLYLSHTVFEVWDHLREMSGWSIAVYAGIVLSVSGLCAWVIWRLFMPAHKTPACTQEDEPALTEAALHERVSRAEEQGMDVAHARSELRQLQARREAGRIYLSMFGEISSGKSSLIKALLPEAKPLVGVRGGTTRMVKEYRWVSPAGDELILSDVPGTNEADGTLDELSRAEAQRSHLVLYVCDGDLSRTQYSELKQLLKLDKPCILALNKTDRYTQAELEQLKTRLRNHLDSHPRAELAGVRAGGMRELLRVMPDGSEEMVQRPLPPQVEELSLAIQRRIDTEGELLDLLRDSAVFSLVAKRLELAEVEHRRGKAEELVRDYTRKAVLGAMAAVAPGADLLIQGYLGVSLIKDLSKLYNVPVRKVDREYLLELVQKEVGKTTTLILAVAGNALKAFPGMGTLAGGLLHAVAYGTIFRCLGRAVSLSFESRGELHPLQTVRSFKEALGEELEVSARDMAKMALELARDKTQGDEYGKR